MDRSIVFCLGTVNAGDIVGELDNYNPNTGDIVIKSPLAVVYEGREVALLNEIMPHQYFINMKGKANVVIHRDRVLYFVLFDYNDDSQLIVSQYKAAIRECLNPTAALGNSDGENSPDF